MRLTLSGSISVVGVVGNPRPLSRTHRLVSAVAGAFAAAGEGRVDAIVDVIDLQDGLFGFGDQAVGAALERVLAADVLVVGSPVYKASYTGLLKSFLDHIAQGQLTGKLALPVMMGGSYHHNLAVENHLRPLLVELGATTATPGLYMLESEIDDVEAVAAQYVQRIAEAIDLRPR